MQRVASVYSICLHIQLPYRKLQVCGKGIICEVFFGSGWRSDFMKDVCMLVEVCCSSKVWRF